MIALFVGGHDEPWLVTPQHVPQQWIKLMDQLHQLIQFTNFKDSESI